MPADTDPSRHHPPGLRPGLAWFDLMVLDGGIARLWRTNMHPVAPGVWRSNQPGPGRLARLRAQGLNSVLNLRAPSSLGLEQIERAACAGLGLKLIELPLRSDVPPSGQTLIDLVSILRSLPRPFLIHCRAGADRSGLAAAVHLLAIEGRPPAVARAQLHWRYGHVAAGPAGVLGRLIDAYADAHAGTGVSFEHWALTGHDPQRLMAAHRARWRLRRGAIHSRRAGPKLP